MKLQQTHINIIKEVINDAHSDAKRTNTEYSVVYVDTLQELITVRSELSGEEFGWQHILSVSPWKLSNKSKTYRLSCRAFFTRPTNFFKLTPTNLTGISKVLTKTTNVTINRRVRWPINLKLRQHLNCYLRCHYD